MPEINVLDNSSSKFLVFCYSFGFIQFLIGKLRQETKIGRLMAMENTIAETPDQTTRISKYFRKKIRAKNPENDKKADVEKSLLMENKARSSDSNSSDSGVVLDGKQTSLMETATWARNSCETPQSLPQTIPPKHTFSPPHRICLCPNQAEIVKASSVKSRARVK